MNDPRFLYGSYIYKSFILYYRPMICKLWNFMIQDVLWEKNKDSGTFYPPNNVMGRNTKVSARQPITVSWIRSIKTHPYKQTRFVPNVLRPTEHILLIFKDVWKLIEFIATAQFALRVSTTFIGGAWEFQNCHSCMPSQWLRQVDQVLRIIGHAVSHIL